MPDQTVEAIGGWIREAGHSPATLGRRLEDIDPAELKAKNIAYFEDYRQRYFNDRLIAGQGVEEILFCLRSHGGKPRRWIDVGAGVTTLFWSIGVETPGEVAAADLVPEALHVLAKFKDSEELPPCYAEALTLLGRPLESFLDTRRKCWCYHVMDCLAPWATLSENGGYDLVTAIGCFGLASGPDAYRTAFGAAAEHLSPTGRIIGADWIRSRKFVSMEGHDNSYLSAALTQDCAHAVGLKLLQCTPVSIQGDDYYDSVIVWAFGRGG